MNELPQVLQKEIWEYVRGDRAFWKQQLKQTVLKVIPYINQNLRNRIKTFRKRGVIDVRVGRMVVSLFEHPIVRMRVNVHANDWTSIPFERMDLDFEEAVKLFYEKVEIEAIRA